MKRHLTLFAQVFGPTNPKPYLHTQKRSHNNLAHTPLLFSTTCSLLTYTSLNKKW